MLGADILRRLSTFNTKPKEFSDRAFTLQTLHIINRVNFLYTPCSSRDERGRAGTKMLMLF